MVLFYIFVISILVIGLLIVEEVLYNNFFVNCEMVKSIVTFSEDYFYQLLLASLGISGVLIALFYANLSGVFSSKYVNLDTSLSFEILREKENNRNIKSIKKLYYHKYYTYNVLYSRNKIKLFNYGTICIIYGKNSNCLY